MSGKKKPDAISQEDWDAVDSPELTDDQLAAMRPAGDVLPDVVDAYRKTRGKQKAPTKQQVTLRLDQDIIAHFKEAGPRWQTRINSVLKAVIRADSEQGSPSIIRVQPVKMARSSSGQIKPKSKSSKSGSKSGETRRKSGSGR